MSDLFKKNRPRLSEDEERALWERVRTIPREAGGRPAGAGGRARAWWEVLWAKPAVRFGAPALAVALVAVVWVTQKEPVAPAHRESSRLATPPAEAPAPTSAPAVEGQPGAPAATIGLNDAAPAPVPRPEAKRSADVTVLQGARNEAAKDERGRSVAGEELAQEMEQRPADAYAPPPPAANAPVTTRESRLMKEDLKAVAGSSAGSAGAAGAAGGDTGAKKQRASAPTTPQAVQGFYREDPKTGTIRAVGEAESGDVARVAQLRAALGNGVSAALIGDRILVEVIAPSRTGTFLETVSLPISGGVARIAVGNAPGSLWVEDGSVRDLVRIAGHEGVADAPTRRRVDLAPSGGGGAAAIVATDGRALRSHFVLADGGERTLAGPRSTTRSRTAALAAELILAVAQGDAATVNKVGDAARRLVAERPDDQAARVLVTWSDDARAAFAER